MEETMNNLERKVRELVQKTDLLPNNTTPIERLLHLFHVGHMGLSLAKLTEAHWDALSILHEANHPIQKAALYAVWASENPHNPLTLSRKNTQWLLNGTKMFCSGAGIVDRALITSEGLLIDVDLTQPSSIEHIEINTSLWVTSAFKDTNTATLTFTNFPVDEQSFINNKGWYLARDGFWQGALGPAACWGGGAAGLVDYSLNNPRQDAHTLVHIAAMESDIWTIRCVLEHAGKEIMEGLNLMQRHQLALRTRHIIEQRCTDILTRFARAYGPFPLACDALIHQRYEELNLFLRQNHGERDLEALGKTYKNIELK